MSTNTANLGLVLEGWIDACRRHDLATIERHLHPAVVWQGITADLVCRDREQLLASIRQAGGDLPEVDVVELHSDRDRVMFGACAAGAGAQTPGAEVYSVVTLADGLIVRLQEFDRREAALAAMLDDDAPGLAPAAATAGRNRRPMAPVDDLIAFVYVADVERSIAFYALLGFDVADTYRLAEALEWAALEAGDARLMLGLAQEPVEPGRQGALFYVYTRDLYALHAHLHAHGARPEAIRDALPGPGREMRVYDPDGYCLMVAQRA